MFAIGDISAETFRSEYWRKKPLHVRSAARSIADVCVDSAEMRILCDRLERVRPGAVTRRRGFLFGQNLDDGAQHLKRISDRYRTLTGTDRVWFDGVVASASFGLGAHYDHSDNVVMQQTGVKRWRLGPPDRIAEADLRRRMLEQPDAGDYPMPEDAAEFVLQPGDVLYIPLFWGHDGVSVGGPSTSLSLVFNADSAIDLLLPELRAAVEDLPAWWRPLPSGDDDIEAHLDELLSTLADAEQRARIRDIWKRRLQRRNIDIACW